MIVQFITIALHNQYTKIYQLTLVSCDIILTYKLIPKAAMVGMI